MPAKSIRIAKVTQNAGAVHVMMANKQGYAFRTTQQALDILSAAEEVFADEVLIVAAARKVGMPNLSTLEGKTITLRIEVDVV